MLSPAHSRIFLAIVDTGSFHGAAERLGMAQSTVSHGLKKLETALGGPLVTRRREGCALTRRGETFFPYARALVAISERALDRLRAERVRIGASSNVGIYVLQPHLRRLRDAGLGEPDLVIGPNPDVADMLDRREIDLGLMEWWDRRAGFVAEPWRTDRLVVIVAADHLWAGRDGIGIEDLFDVPLLGGERGTGTGTLLRDVLGPAAARLAARRQLGSTEAVKRAVAAGLGISLVLESAVAEEVAAGRLAALPVKGAALEKTLWAIAPGDLLRTGRTAEMMRLLMEPAP